MFLKHLRITIISLILFTILTGMIYPLAVTGISQLIFPGNANGSLIKKEGKVLAPDLSVSLFLIRSTSGAGFQRLARTPIMQDHQQDQTMDP